MSGQSNAGAGRRGGKRRSSELKKLKKKKAKLMEKLEKTKQKEHDIRMIRLAVRIACLDSRDGLAIARVNGGGGKYYTGSTRYSTRGRVSDHMELRTRWEDMGATELKYLAMSEWAPSKPLSPLERLAKSAVGPG